jgi:hypothetical protein
MKQLCVVLMVLGWFAVPDFVLADWSTYSQRFWIDRHTDKRGMLERDSLIHRVESPRFEDHFDLKLGKDGVKSGSGRDQQSDSAVSGKGMRSYDSFLSPSFDIPGSVNGHSDSPNRWWERRGEGERMRKDLKDLNRDPMKNR